MTPFTPHPKNENDKSQFITLSHRTHPPAPLSWIPLNVTHMLTISYRILCSKAR